MEPFDEDWELAPENAHPRARELLKLAFFWEIADEGSPLGNDTGSDTLAYREWRSENPEGQVEEFITRILEDWEVKNTDWRLIDEKPLEAALQEDHFSILTRDDVVIAVAFAQLVLEGEVDSNVREMALFSLRRQATRAVISFRGWDDINERLERLEQMQKVLERTK